MHTLCFIKLCSTANILHLHANFEYIWITAFSTSHTIFNFMFLLQIWCLHLIKHFKLLCCFTTNIYITRNRICFLIKNLYYFKFYNIMNIIFLQNLCLTTISVHPFQLCLKILILVGLKKMRFPDFYLYFVFIFLV